MINKLKTSKNYVKYIIITVLFVITIVFCLIPSNSSAKSNVKLDDETIYKEAQKKLINNNYKYLYKEYNSKKKITKIYNGVKNDIENIGYYESNKEVFKYSCKNEKCYKVYTDHEEEYQMELSNYLNPKYIFEIIKNLNRQEKKEEEQKIYIYTNNDKTVEIKIILLHSSITKIIIIDGNTEYNLSYE